MNLVGPEARSLQIEHLGRLIHINTRFQVHQILERIQCAERGRPKRSTKIVNNERWQIGHGHATSQRRHHWIISIRRRTITVILTLHLL